MTLHIECPKCTGRAGLHTTVGDVWIKCLCGYQRAIERTTREGVTIHTGLPANEVRLPRQGSKLSICLQALRLLAEASTKELAVQLRQNNSDTASQLTILLGKGLVYRTIERRGVEGGSTWRLTTAAVAIFKGA